MSNYPKDWENKFVYHSLLDKCLQKIHNQNKLKKKFNKKNNPPQYGIWMKYLMKKKRL
jgi:hypothetical protein